MIPLFPRGATAPSLHITIAAPSPQQAQAWTWLWGEILAPAVVAPAQPPARDGEVRP